MKKINLLAMLFLLCHALVFAQADTPHFLSSTSWELVDIQAENGSKLSEAEDNALGAVWHFITKDTLVVETDDGLFLMPYSYADSQINYLGKSIEITENQNYRLLLLDKAKGRSIKGMLMKREALDAQRLKEAQRLDASAYYWDRAFDLSFEVIKMREGDITDAPPPPPPPSLPVKIGTENPVYRVVEDMPRFPGCESEATKKAKSDCATKELLEYVYKSLKYPQAARDQGIEGTVVVTFVVEKDGSVSGAKLVRTIGGGCDEEALRVINAMNDENIIWIPGMQRGGELVRVQFNLPVKFKL